MNDPVLIGIPSGEMPSWVEILFKRLESIEAKLGGQPEPLDKKPVLTRAEAKKYVNKNSDSAFDRWIAMYAPTARSAMGRYSRPRLDIARSREAGRVAAQTSQ